MGCLTPACEVRDGGGMGVIGVEGGVVLTPAREVGGEGGVFVYGVKMVSPACAVWVLMELQERMLAISACTVCVFMRGLG